jgi:hypothetical protein
VVAVGVADSLGDTVSPCVRDSGGDTGPVEVGVCVGDGAGDSAGDPVGESDADAVGAPDEDALAGIPISAATRSPETASPTPVARIIHRPPRQIVRTATAVYTSRRAGTGSGW